MSGALCIMSVVRLMERRERLQRTSNGHHRCMVGRSCSRCGKVRAVYIGPDGENYCYPCLADLREEELESAPRGW